MSTIAGKEMSMIELTDDQQRELSKSSGPVHVLDPATKTEYVLVRADIHSRFRLALEQAADELEQEAWADAVDEARSEMASE
jgi:hypothetical protein